MIIAPNLERVCEQAFEDSTVNSMIAPNIKYVEKGAFYNAIFLK